MLGRAEEAGAAKTSFIAKYGEPSAEQWLNQGFVFARPAERDLFVQAFRQIGLPVCAPPEQRPSFTSLLQECAKT
jgi:hypothetical protein